MERWPLENGNGAELVLAYCARTLAQDECAAFERHMLSCAGCRELAAAQQAVWSALDTWTPEPIFSNFDEKLYQRIALEDQSPCRLPLFQANWSWLPPMPFPPALCLLIP